MDIWEKGAEILQKIPREYYLPLGVGCIGLILFVYGIGVVVHGTQPRENSSTFHISQTASGQQSASGAQQTIKIDVEGAVLRPGVYSIKADARVQDGLIAAGGFSQDADREWVTHHVNLAAKLMDGVKLYIPHEGEVAEASGIDVTTGDILGSSNQQININTASASDLDSLPGIGSVTAQKIIAGRPYGSIQDLVDKQVIGQKEFDKIKDSIVAN